MKYRSESYYYPGGEKPHRPIDIGDMYNMPSLFRRDPRVVEVENSLYFSPARREVNNPDGNTRVPQPLLAGVLLLNGVRYMGRRAKDITGQVFKNWKVLHRDTSIHSSNAYWVCQDTNTGEQKSLPACQLKASVGYKVNKSVKIPSIGSKINKWTVISDAQKSDDNTLCFRIQCQCGKERTITIHMISNLSQECRTCHMRRMHGTLDKE
jgi:hypothetical protein